MSIYPVNIDPALPRANVGSVPEWDAEIEVDEVLAGQLIRASYPEVEAEPLRVPGCSPCSSAQRWPRTHGNGASRHSRRRRSAA